MKPVDQIRSGPGATSSPRPTGMLARDGAGCASPTGLFGPVQTFGLVTRIGFTGVANGAG